MNDKQSVNTMFIATAVLAIVLFMTVIGLSTKYEHLQQEIVKHECASWSYDQKLIWK